MQDVVLRQEQGGESPYPGASLQGIALVDIQRFSH